MKINIIYVYYVFALKKKGGIRFKTKINCSFYGEGTGNNRLNRKWFPRFHSGYFPLDNSSVKSTKLIVDKWKTYWRRNCLVNKLKSFNCWKLFALMLVTLMCDFQINKIKAIWLYFFVRFVTEGETLIFSVGNKFDAEESVYTLW